MVSAPPKPQPRTYLNASTYSQLWPDRIIPNGVCYYESVACSHGPVVLVYGNHDPFPACDWHADFARAPSRRPECARDPLCKDCAKCGRSNLRK